MAEINEYAQYAIDFISQLKHTKDPWAGINFSFMDWQLNDVIIPLFGNVDKNGYRIYRKCYIEIPKKNGKSELAAAKHYFCLWLMVSTVLKYTALHVIDNRHQSYSI